MVARWWIRSFRVWLIALASVLAGPGATEGLLPPGPDEVLAIPAESSAFPEGERPATDSEAGEAGSAPSRVALPLRRFGAVDPDERIQRAWRDRGKGIEARAARVRNTTLGLGIRDLDAAARALLHDDSLGSRSERTEAAVRIAPGLPDAHAGLAWSRLVDGHDSAGAVASLRAGLRSLPDHLEGSAWLRASAVDALTRGLLWSGLLFLLVAAGAVASGSVRWLSQRFGMPAVSAAAGLAALVLLPAALGEGVAGIALACAALALIWGSTAQRCACVGAGVALFLALHPLADWREAELAVLARAPVAEAVHRAERTLPTALDGARLEWAASADPLAARALAVQARRSGDLVKADADFRKLLAVEEAAEVPVPELLANAANVRLALGRLDDATALYERAAQVRPTPLLLFNLSQVYGRAIRLEEQDLALAEAQTFDPEAVRELIALVAAHDGVGVVDLALPPPAVRARAEAVGLRGKPSLRSRFAPGVLGGSLAGAGLGLCLAVVGGLLGGRAVHARPLRSDSVARRQGSTDPTARMARMHARRLRDRRLEQVRSVLAGVVPGLCALQKGRTFLGVLAVVAAVATVLCFVAREGIVPDPLAAGGIGSFLFGSAACAAAVLYGVATALSFMIEEASEPCP